MIYEIKIRVKTPILGSRRDHKGIWRFDRNDGGWEVDQKHWNGLTNNAIRNLELECDRDQIRFPDVILLPRVELYRRVWKERGKNKEIIAYHECIRKGTLITLVAVTLDWKWEQRVRPPDKNELAKIFQNIGDFEGLSPFGSKFGYGRFSLESICPMGRSIAGGVESAGIAQAPSELPGKEAGTGLGEDEPDQLHRDGVPGGKDPAAGWSDHGENGDASGILEEGPVSLGGKEHPV